MTLKICDNRIGRNRATEIDEVSHPIKAFPKHWVQDYINKTLTNVKIVIILSTSSLSNVKSNLVLVNVHLLLDLLLQTLLLLVLRFRAAGNDARLLLLVLVSNSASARNARLLVAKSAGAWNAVLLVLVSNGARGRGRNASSLSSTDVACCVGARGSTSGEARVDGVGLHALALDVGVLADLLAACGGDGAGVDAVIGLCHCDGATAAELRVFRAEGGGHAAADSLFVGNVLVGVHGVGGGFSGAGGDCRGA
jgi:hypothetical protein